MSNETVSTKDQVIAIVKALLEDYDIAVDEQQVLDLVKPLTDRVDAIEQRLAKIEAALAPVANDTQRLNDDGAKPISNSTKARVKLKS